MFKKESLVGLHIDMHIHGNKTYFSKDCHEEQRACTSRSGAVVCWRWQGSSNFCFAGTARMGCLGHGGRPQGPKSSPWTPRSPPVSRHPVHVNPTTKIPKTPRLDDLRWFLETETVELSWCPTRKQHLWSTFSPSQLQSYENFKNIVYYCTWSWSRSCLNPFR